MIALEVTSIPGFAQAWHATILDTAPLIAPARQFVFPVNVPGEEEALARGALWLQIRPEQGQMFLAQCALGFAGSGVATGVWPTPNPHHLLAVAGGYAYRIDTSAPEHTALLPLKPVVAVRAAAAALVLVGFHALGIVTAHDTWQSPRISWEGITITAIDGQQVHGTGWDLRTDRELPFTLDLQTRRLSGGAYPAASAE